MDTDTPASATPDPRIVADVEEIVADLRVIWDEAARRLGYRDAWEVLVKALDRYGMTSWMLWDLYRHGTLAACRRLLDKNKHTLSVVTVLKRLKRIAPKITLDVLLATRTGTGTTITPIAPQVSIRDIPDDETLDRATRHRVADAIRNLHDVNGSPEHDHITNAAVARDIDALLHEHTDVVQLSHAITAHRNRDGAQSSVDQDDIDRLLHHVLDVIEGWIGLLEDTDIRARTIDVPEIPAMAKALELFDWHEYQQAREERERAIGPRITAEQAAMIEDSAIRYVWPQLEQD